jgi:hypothetical protein
VSREQVEQIIARVKADIRGEKKASKRKPSDAVLLFPQHMAELDVFVRREVRVCDDRRWKLDFAEREVRRPRLAFEIEGGIWTSGRHARGKGMQDDMDKYNRAIIEGFILFRFSSQDVLCGKAKETVRLWLNVNR